MGARNVLPWLLVAVEVVAGWAQERDSCYTADRRGQLLQGASLQRTLLLLVP